MYVNAITCDDGFNGNNLNDAKSAMSNSIWVHNAVCCFRSIKIRLERIYLQKARIIEVQVYLEAKQSSHLAGYLSDNLNITRDKTLKETLNSIDCKQI